MPGTPEEVWDAIATGPGITAWFVPTECDEREGGSVVQHHGPGAGMQVTAEITGWDPPRRLAYETEAGCPTRAPSPARMATEFLVEARAGGTCVVRVVNSGFGSGEEWDQAIESTRSGWGPALAGLRLYLEHFRRRAASLDPGRRPVPGHARRGVVGPARRAGAARRRRGRPGGHQRRRGARTSPARWSSPAAGR